MSSVFSVEKPEDSPGFLLWQTTVTWQRLIKKTLDEYNISHAQFVILAITLWFENQKHEVSQSLIIRQSKLDKMTVSKSFKKLAKEGYVKRIEHKIDTRAKTVYLTKKGRELISKLVPLVEKIDADFFGILKKSNQRLLIDVLNTLISETNVAD
jgi:DNA-binding MarR family transcriptional regulator